MATPWFSGARALDMGLVTGVAGEYIVLERMIAAGASMDFISNLKGNETKQNRSENTFS
jgi:hypothetical protein